MTYLEEMIDSYVDRQGQYPHALLSKLNKLYDEVVMGVDENELLDFIELAISNTQEEIERDRSKSDDDDF